MWYDKSQKPKRHLFYMQASVLYTRLFISGKTHAYNNLITEKAGVFTKLLRKQEDT